MSKQLHVFSDNVINWVVAYDPEDAMKAYEETTGQPWKEFEDDDNEFTQEPDETELTIIEEEMNIPEPIPTGAVLVKKEGYQQTYQATCRAWADARGRGLLCSTEY
jgi:hypothetical protein